MADAEPTVQVELTLEESGMLFWLLHANIPSDEELRKSAKLSFLKLGTLEAIRRRQMVLLAKLECTNNALRDKESSCAPLITSDSVGAATEEEPSAEHP